MTAATDPQRELPAGPFVDWLNAEYARVEIAHENGEVGPAEQLADRLGWGATQAGARRLNRYRNRMRSGSRDGVKGEYPTDTYPAAAIEDALTAAGVEPAMLYPTLRVGQPRFGRAWCASCREPVAAMPDGTCAWCQTPTLAKDGPYGECGCGCGATIRLFDAKSRPVRYRRGHAPRSLEKPKPPVPIGPFVEFVRRDVLPGRTLREAADALGLNHAYLAELLRGRTSGGEAKRTMQRKTVQRSLRKWGSQGRGRPWRDGTPRFTDLYGQLVCPACGGRKARASVRCRACARGRRVRRRSTAQQQKVPLRPNVKMTAYTLGQARRMHLEDGLSLREVSRRLIHRTEYASEASMAMALSAQFRRRGWPVRARDAATADANRRRAFRPRCEHVHAVGARQGQQCERQSVGDPTDVGPRCWKHHPDRIADGIARLRATDNEAVAA